MMNLKKASIARFFLMPTTHFQQNPNLTYEKLEN